MEANQEMPKELSDHDQKYSWNEDNVLASINTSMVNTSIASSLGLILAGVDANES